MEGGPGDTSRDIHKDPPKTHGPHFGQTYGLGRQEWKLHRVEHARLDDAKKRLGYAYWIETKHKAIVADPFWCDDAHGYYTKRAVTWYATWSRAYITPEQQLISQQLVFETKCLTQEFCGGPEQRSKISGREQRRGLYQLSGCRGIKASIATGQWAQ